jgi:hypothetical protein
MTSFSAAIVLLIRSVIVRSVIQQEPHCVLACSTELKKVERERRSHLNHNR